MLRRIFGSKKLKIYIIGTIMIMSLSVIFTKVSIESQDRKDSMSGMIYDLEILSDQLDDYCELTERQEIEESLYILGQIRRTAWDISMDDWLGNGEMTQNQLVISSVVSEIWVFADIRNYRLDEISIEYSRINEVLKIIYSLSGTNEGKLTTLADRLEQNLELMYPVE